MSCTHCSRPAVWEVENQEAQGTWFPSCAQHLNKTCTSAQYGDPGDPLTVRRV